MWDETDTNIQSGHKSPQDFQEETLKTVCLNEKEGIDAVVGKQKDKETMAIQSYLFSKDKGWTLRSARIWFDRLNPPIREHLCAVLPFTVSEKILDKPLRIEGLAMTIGMSRNFNIYTPEELASFANKLVNAPVYLEHVTANDAIGKVIGANWDGQSLRYAAEIYEEDTAEKIRKGLIRHVSVGADYETVDLVNGKVPHGLYNAEMSLVAVPGIPQTNIQILEKLQQKEEPKRSQIVEDLIKRPSEPTMPINQIIDMIEGVLPSGLVQRCWSLGPQRLCQELNRIVLKLRQLEESHYRPQVTEDELRENEQKEESNKND